MIQSYHDYVNKGHSSGRIYSIPAHVIEQYSEVVQMASRLNTQGCSLIRGMSGYVTPDQPTKYTIANVWAEVKPSLTNCYGLMTSEITVQYLDSAQMWQPLHGLQAFQASVKRDGDGITDALLSLLLGRVQTYEMDMLDHCSSVLNWMHSETSTPMQKMDFTAWLNMSGMDVLRREHVQGRSKATIAGCVVASAFMEQGVILSIDDTYSNMPDLIDVTRTAKNR